MHKLRDLIDRKFPTIIATTSVDGQPNIAPATDVKLLDDKTILIAHNEMVKTVENIQEGSNAALLILDDRNEGFRIWGTAEYYSDDDRCSELTSRHFADNKTVPLGIIVIEIDNIKEIK